MKTPTTIPALLDLIRDNSNIIVQFTADAKLLESYPEEGMKAKVLKASVTNTHCIAITVDYSEFNDHNLKLESHNYYDNNSEACLTAREARCYRPIEELYFDLTENPSKYFTVIALNKSELGTLKEKVATYEEFLTELANSDLNNIDNGRKFVSRALNLLRK